MRVTCICVCHDKPDVAHEAIESILRQSHRDWQAIIVDSGVLYDAGYYNQFSWRNDPRIQLIRSNETEATRRNKAMAPWCFNECIRQRMVAGDLIVYLCDDDLLYPNAFETFVAYCQKNPDAQAMYASQDIGIVYPNGWHAIVGERRATVMGGRGCNGRRMDCEIDYLQFCHRREVLSQFSTDEYWPEAKQTEEHADGIFLERVGAFVPVHPIDVKVSQNRRTPRSLNIPMSPVGLLDCMANGVPLGTGNVGRVESSRPAVATVSAGLEDSTRPTFPTSTPQVTIAINRADRTRLGTVDYPRLEWIEVESSNWNEALERAQGEYFLPIEPGTSLMPNALRRLLERLQRNPRHSAVTGYLLATTGDDSTPAVSVKNVVGSGLFRTADLRSVGGFDLNGGRSTNIWSTFFRLVNSGRQVDILPEHVFVSTVDSNHAALAVDALKPFVAMDHALAAEREATWKALTGYEQRLIELMAENRHLNARLALLKYRIADRVHALLGKIPFVVSALKWLFGAWRLPFRKKAKTPAIQPAILRPVAKNASAAA